MVGAFGLRPFAPPNAIDFPLNSSTPAQDHAQGARQKSAAGNGRTRIRNQLRGAETDLFRHLQGFTFLVEFKSVIALGGLERSAEKDESVVGKMMGEVVAVIRKRGLDPKPFMDLMTSTNFGGRAHKLFGDKIVTQNYEPGFVIPLALKDVRLALTEAENAGVPMPSVAVVRDRMITGIARGHAGLDWSALGLIAAEEAGIVSATTGTTQPQAPAEGAKS